MMSATAEPNLDDLARSRRQASNHDGIAKNGLLYPGLQAPCSSMRARPKAATQDAVPAAMLECMHVCSLFRTIAGSRHFVFKKARTNPSAFEVDAMMRGCNSCYPLQTKGSNGQNEPILHIVFIINAAFAGPTAPRLRKARERTQASRDLHHDRLPAHHDDGMKRVVHRVPSRRSHSSWAHEPRLVRPRPVSACIRPFMM
jgi:hypothetical protein